MILYIGSEVKIVLDAGIDISKASLLEIRYKKPNGDRGVWAAILDDTTKLAYVLKKEDLAAAPGIWQWQAYVVIQGKGIYGEIEQQVVSAGVNGDS